VPSPHASTWTRVFGSSVPVVPPVVPSVVPPVVPLAAARGPAQPTGAGGDGGMGGAGAGTGAGSTPPRPTAAAPAGCAPGGPGSSGDGCEASSPEEEVSVESTAIPAALLDLEPGSRVVRGEGTVLTEEEVRELRHLVRLARTVQCLVAASATPVPGYTKIQVLEVVHALQGLTVLP
jgi:hypothetical protein